MVTRMQSWPEALGLPSKNCDFLVMVFVKMRHIPGPAHLLLLSAHL